MTADLNNFPARLRACMDERKLSYGKTAKLLETSPKRVFAWVKGYNLPQAYYVAKMCEVFEVSADWLLLGRGQK